MNDSAVANFAWGVATAAYQTEGAYNTDGKGPSIWDSFTNKKGAIFQNQNGNTACDFYNRYAADIMLMSKLQIPNFRFSVSWARILPTGTGHVNQAGIDFYNRVIDLCLELNIKPWITLYHWDLPQALQDKGGWTNRDIIQWFGDYVQLCILKFGDRVTHWMVLNEPMVFTGAGYFLGLHAPGRKGLSNFLAAVHHAAMCQAHGGRIIKSLKSTANVGTTFSCTYVQPNTQAHLNVAAARRVDALLNRTFIEPLAGMGYPVADLKLLNRLAPFVKDGDEAKLAFKMDFIGLQCYTREVVGHSYLTPFIHGKIIPANKRGVATTLMNWEVYPQCIYHMLQQFSRYPFSEIIVTENGAAFSDVVDGGKVYDEQRCYYLQQHIQQILRARTNGVKVNGYFAWTLLDNFEWAEGYRPRFGLVHVNFQSQKRIIKSSGYWYANFIRQNQFHHAKVF